MEQTPNKIPAQTAPGTETKPRRKAADWVYQAATVAAALLLLLTVTV
ncbi:hypothetical protein [Alloacidobacterium sp.]|nr:hypothetical protein [Alloacidobacterium sp.]HYK36261.1 hypothetical protein [Alloacidobacterium sp.]